MEVLAYERFICLDDGVYEPWWGSNLGYNKTSLWKLMILFFVKINDFISLLKPKINNYQC